jgi:7-cyano-7-deazaguanine reductase
MTTNVLGTIVQHAVERLDTIKFDKPPQEVEFVTHELASICPVTNQPDISTVVITYAPDDCIIESKSLKLYLWGFRNVGIFCEAIAVEIAERVMIDAHPHNVSVTVKQQARGGIVTTATAQLAKETL